MRHYLGPMRGGAVLCALVLCGCGDDSGGGEEDTDDPTGSASATAGMTAGMSAGSGPSSGPGTSGSGTGSDTTDPATSDPGTEDDSTGSTTGGDDGPNVDLSDPQLYEFELDPAELDPTVAENIELQYAHLDTRAQPIGKLVFFLSGFTNTPASWRMHGVQLAGHGFHVVEPHYNNSWSCGGMGGDCSENTRWEALTGEDTSTVIDTSRADSAEGRVITMLQYLRDEHPGGDWGYYLNDDDTLRDEHVIIAGISHGASSSGLFGTRRQFHRVVMHSGGWWNVGDDPATPISEFYGFAHTGDEQYDGIISAWEGAGMLGTPTTVDGAMPPFGDAHQLISSAESDYPHCCVCVHNSSPRNGEDYVFDPAWRYMYGAPQAE